MVCVPLAPLSPTNGDAFNFSRAPDVNARAVENMTTLWFAPWKAWCAVASEAMDVAPYVRPLSRRD